MSQGRLTVICCFCGEIKGDPFEGCGHCNGKPESEDELILSALLTEIFTEKQQLSSTAAKIREGRTPGFSDEVRKIFVQFMKEEGIL